MVKLAQFTHTDVTLDICHHYINSRLFPIAFLNFRLNVKIETFKWNRAFDNISYFVEDILLQYK